MPEEYVIGAFKPMIPVCPITFSPIRFAIIDPTSNKVFEKHALENWVKKNNSLP